MLALVVAKVFFSEMKLYENWSGWRFVRLEIMFYTCLIIFYGFCFHSMAIVMYYKTENYLK